MESSRCVHLCLLEEMEQMIFEENPEMKRADALELVQEWILPAERYCQELWIGVQLRPQRQPNLD